MSVKTKSHHLLSFALAAAAMLTPAALKAQTPAPETAGGLSCASEVNLNAITRADDGVRTYASFDKPVSVDCSNSNKNPGGDGKGRVIYSFDAAAGVITNPPGFPLDSYLQNFAQNALMNGADLNTVVPLPHNPENVLGDKTPYLRQLTFTVRGREKAELGNNSAVGFTAGLLDYSQGAASVGSISNLSVQHHILLEAPREDYNSTAIIGMVGGTGWGRMKAGPGSILFAGTVGSERGRGAYGVTTEGSATLYEGPLYVSAHAERRAADAFDLAQTFVGVNAGAVEKFAGFKLQEILEVNRFNNRIGFPSGHQKSVSGAVVVEKGIGKRLTLYGALSAGGNSTPIGGLTGGDFESYGQYFKAFELGGEVKITQAFSFVAGGGLASKFMGPAQNYTLGDLLQGTQPGNGSYGDQHTFFVGVRFRQPLFHLGKN